MSRTGEKYGMERLLNLFRERIALNSSVSPKEVTALVLEDIDRHAGMAVQNDDITFIALKCCPPVKTESELRVEIEKHN
jgi:serine phosphatase RsbU (regulator of sigma subunit)